MTDFTLTITDHSFWGWLSVAAILLGLEIFLGTQWLLWMAAAAAAVSALTLAPMDFGLPLQVLAFSVISVVFILISQRFMRPKAMANDINDTKARLIGSRATVLSGFSTENEGLPMGRVTYDDVVWPAVLMEKSDAPKPDDQVEIIAVVDGKLEVRLIKS